MVVTVWLSWLSGMSRCSTYDQLIDPKANLNLNHNPNPKQSNLRFTSHHVNKVRLSVTIPFTRSIHRITEQIFRNFNITIRFAFTKNTISKILTITIRACGWRLLLYPYDTKEPCYLVSMYWIKYNNAMYWYYSHTLRTTSDETKAPAARGGGAKSSLEVWQFRKT